MGDGVDRAARERAKAIAEQQRAARRQRKRRCVLCGVEESERVPLGPHPDGIGPACREEAACMARRANR